MLIAGTTAGEFKHDTQTGVLNAFINGPKQLLAQNPLTASEANAVVTLSAAVAWYFGHRKGYNDRTNGLPYKHFGVI